MNPDEETETWLGTTTPRSDAHAGAFEADSLYMRRQGSLESLVSSTGIDHGDLADFNGLRELSVDDILVNSIGELGWAQKVHFSIVSLGWLCEALHVLIIIFADRMPPWRCVTLDAGLAAPLVQCTQESSICALRRDQWEWVDKMASSVSEFDLICSDDWKSGFLGSSHFFGFLIGAGIFGALSDGILGRKRALFTCVGLAAMFGYMTAFSPTYWMYAAIRLLTGIAAGGLGMVAFVLAYEPIGPTYRGEMGIAAQYFFTAGIMVLTLMAYFVRNWRMLYIVASIPATLLLLAWSIVWESPRWLLVHGRVDEAMAVLSAIARGNGTSMPSGATLKDPMKDTLRGSDEALPTSPLMGDASPTKAGRSGNGRGMRRRGKGRAEKTASKKTEIFEVFRVPLTRKWMLAMLFIWYTCSTVYYGLSLNVGSLGSNLYISSFLIALVEVPSYMLASCLLGTAGRRLTQAGFLLLSGLCCVLCSLVQVPVRCKPEGMRCTAKTLSVTLALIGKFGIAAAFNVIFVYTSELFPTVVRNGALGLSSQAARLGGILAPLIVVMGRSWPALPFAVFGVLGLIAGMLTFVLKETLNKPLYETMDMLEEGERIRSPRGVIVVERDA